MILKPVNCMYQIEFHNLYLSHIILYHFYNNCLLLVLDRIQTYKCYLQLIDQMNGLLYYKKIGSTIFFYTWQLYLECIHIVNVNYIFGKKMKMMPCRK